MAAASSPSSVSSRSNSPTPEASAEESINERLARLEARCSSAFGAAFRLQREVQECDARLAAGANRIGVLQDEVNIMNRQVHVLRQDNAAMATRIKNTEHRLYILRKGVAGLILCNVATGTVGAIKLNRLAKALESKSGIVLEIGAALAKGS